MHATTIIRICNDNHTATMGVFFGQGVAKRYKKGKLTETSFADRHTKFADPADSPGVICNVCGKRFTHPPALVAHRKFCVDAHALLSEPTADDSDDAEATAEASESRKKIRKNGKVKLTGWKAGHRRMQYLVWYKYQVAVEYQIQLRKKEVGLVNDPLAKTSALFNNLPLSMIWKWHQKMVEFETALAHERCATRSQER